MRPELQQAIRISVALAIVLAAAAGCAPTPESDPPVAFATATKQRQQENLAVRGKGDASVEKPFVARAIDGDPENSLEFAAHGAALVLSHS